MTDTTSDECLWQALGECYAELTDIPPGEDRVLAAILKVCEEVAISAIIQGFPLVPAVLAAYQAAIRSPLVQGCRRRR